MRYYYDCEFIDDGLTIDLISIGMVAEDGREFYAISTEFVANKASDWVKENVLIHLPKIETKIYSLGKDVRGIGVSNTHIPDEYKSRLEIKNSILDFCNPEKYGKPEFWAYYADYDHVALCQLFGTMMDLPKGWPMYTCDIKQLCDSLGNHKLPEQKEGEHNALADARHNRVMYEYLLKIQCC